MVKRLLDEATATSFVIVAIFVVIFAGIKALIINSKKRTFFNIIVSFSIGVPVGLVAGLIALQEFNANDSIAILIGSVGALIGEQIVMALAYSKFDLGKLIERGLTNLVDKFTK